MNYSFLCCTLIISSL